MGGELRIGTSGWQHPHWRGIFYPPGLATREWFGHYAKHFDTVEVNNTFYRLPAPEVFTAWRRQAPAGFLYAVKMSRFATHMKHLKDPEQPLELFLSRARKLGRRLGPVLVQLPPQWKVNLERLDGFLRAAAPRNVRWAVELRNPTWLGEETYEVLRAHGAALVIHDGLADHPRERVTAEFVYLRYHGSGTTRYAGTYAPRVLRAEAERIREQLASGLDVYAYFNNDLDGHAIGDARKLRSFLSPTPREARP